MGFDTHFHRDMNIITFIIEGLLEHKDSMGNGSQIKAGEWQYMSAGSGVQHSEFNPSSDQTVHLLQIWIKPNAHGLSPRYAQLAASPKTPSFFRTIATSEEKEGQIRLDQNASIHHVRMQTKEERELRLSFGTGWWIQLVQGELGIFSEVLHPGDGASIEKEDSIVLEALAPNTEFVIFELV
jgi:redox-sensitive bicupin YhaK (pirin superfamily)